MNPPNQCLPKANNMVETNKTMEAEAKNFPINDDPKLTNEEYNQLMAMIQKNNDGN